MFTSTSIAETFKIGNTSGMRSKERRYYVKKSIKFIFVLMALSLFLAATWDFVLDATDVRDQTLTFLRNYEVDTTCIWVEFLKN